jgi:hypothetical protein
LVRVFEFFEDFGSFLDDLRVGAFVALGVLVGLGDMEGKQDGATLRDGK